MTLPLSMLQRRGHKLRPSQAESNTDFYSSQVANLFYWHNDGVFLGRVFDLRCPKQIELLSFWLPVEFPLLSGPKR